MADEIIQCPIKAANSEDGRALQLTGADELNQITGTVDAEFSDFLLTTLTRSMPSTPQTLRETVNAALQAMHSMKPTDAIEGMLCSQIVTLYAQGMAFLQRAQAALPEHASHYYAISSKALKLHQESIERLERYRRKGKQQIHIEHVHINEGAQAVIGTLQRGG